MKKFNIATKKSYTSKGEEKVFWATVGTMTEFDDGKLGMELNMFQEKFYIFPIEEKVAGTGDQEKLVKDGIEIKVEPRDEIMDALTNAPF